MPFCQRPFCNFKQSMRYNPFRYLRCENDILKLVNCIMENTKGEDSFLLMLYLGILLRPSMILSVCVRRILLSNFGSMKGFMSSGVPQRALPLKSRSVTVYPQERIWCQRQWRQSPGWGRRLPKTPSQVSIHMISWPEPPLLWRFGRRSTLRPFEAFSHIPEQLFLLDP